MGPDFADNEHDRKYYAHQFAPNLVHRVGNGEETPEKSGKAKQSRLSEADLREITSMMVAANNADIGTFHMPQFGNRKVKFDATTGQHYINF
jgi:hypothetical protein